MHKFSPYKGGRIPLAQFTGEGGYYYNLFSSPSKVLFISLGGSALAGYETINWNEKNLCDGSRINDIDNFLYGGAVTLEVENYITDNLALFLHIRERLLFNTAIDKFHFQWGLGLKYLIK